MTAAFKLTAPEPSEKDIHISCAQAFERLVLAPAVWVFYPAGAIELTEHQKAKLYRMGMKSGFPDFVFWHFGTFGLEIKKQGGRLSSSRWVKTLKKQRLRYVVGQRERFPELLAAGWSDIQVVHSVEAALAQLEAWRIPLRCWITYPGSATLAR
jgi:hypothetical protein